MILVFSEWCLCNVTFRHTPQICGRLFVFSSPDQYLVMVLARVRSFGLLLCKVRKISFVHFTFTQLNRFLHLPAFIPENGDRASVRNVVCVALRFREKTGRHLQDSFFQNDCHCMIMCAVIRPG